MLAEDDPDDADFDPDFGVACGNAWNKVIVIELLRQLLPLILIFFLFYIFYFNETNRQVILILVILCLCSQFNFDLMSILFYVR